MKKLLAALFILLTLTLFTACKENNAPEETPYVLFSGDIEGAAVKVDLSLLTKKTETFDGESLECFALSDALNEVKLLPGCDRIMFTATDGKSAIVDADTAGSIYLYRDNGGVSVKAPVHPRSAGIKKIADITLISSSVAESGIKILTPSDESMLSYGNFKLKLCTPGAVNKLNGVEAVPAVMGNVSAEKITGDDKNTVYCADYDMFKAEGDCISWYEGRPVYSKDGIKKNIYGIAAGTDTVIYDAFTAMKNALDGGERVMLILPDGFSYKQAETFKAELSLFGSGYTLAASVNPAISPVALASIITGAPPFKTGITGRAFKTTESEDIFKYASDRGKSVKYIEGNGKLTGTSVDPVLNLPDIHGSTDRNVFDSAAAQLASLPDLLFVHFHGIDDVNHNKGPYGAEAKAKILEIEGYIVSLINGFDGTVIIVPDHGHILYYENDSEKGKHGMFSYEDMYVPYYVFKN